MKRRDFLIGMAGAAGLAAGAGAFVLRSPADDDLAVVTGNLRQFIRYSLTDGTRLAIPTNTIAHSFTRLPEAGELVLGVEKSGPMMTLVDFGKGQVVGDVRAPPNRFYYGHVCPTADGRGLYSTQIDHVTGQGYLVLYDTRTFAVAKEWNLSPGGNHDIAWMPDGRTLAITTSGVAFPNEEYGKPKPKAVRVAPSRVVFFDTVAEKTVKTWDHDDARTILGHLRVGADGRVHLITTMFDGSGGPGAGAVLVASMTEPPREWKVPEEVRAGMKGELLSVVIDERAGLLAATNPDGGKLLQFDLRDGKFLAADDVKTNGLAWASGRTLYGWHPGDVATRETESGARLRLLPFGDGVEAAHSLLIKKS